MRSLEIGLDKNRIDGIYPKSSSKDYYRANRSDNVVLSVDQNLLTVSVVRFYSEMPEPENKLYLHDGYLYGVDRGEWGGCVFFIPEKDVDSTIIELNRSKLSFKWIYPIPEPKTGELYYLLNENFRGFAKNGCRKFVFTGFAHMCTDEGCLYEIVLEEEIWVAKEMFILDSYPHVFTQVGATIYLATSDRLVEISLAGDKPIINVIVEDLGWGGLYPNSMVCAKDSIYVGLRGFVYEHNLKSGKAKWYNYLSYDKESVKELENNEWFLSRP